jgi:hypothetical protein
MAFLGIAAAGYSVAKNISLKTPSEARAASVIPDVVKAANAGNMLAVKVLDERRTIGIAAERAEWVKGYAQVTPAMIQKYNTVKSTLPAADHTGPEAAAGWALGAREQYTYTPSAAERIFSPILVAGAAAEDSLRDGYAEAVERLGVGGAAALAQEVRGSRGPLDQLIEFAQKPAGTAALVVGGVLVVFVLAFALGGRR